MTRGVRQKMVQTFFFEGGRKERKMRAVTVNLFHSFQRKHEYFHKLEIVPFFEPALKKTKTNSLG